MDFNLSDEQKMIQAGAKEFADSVIRPRAAEIDKTSQFPRDIVGQLAELGYYGLQIPAEHGGVGAGYLSYVVALEQICRASLVCGVTMAVHALTEESIVRFGNEEQKNKYLPLLASGKWLSSFAFTEPATGSDPKAVETKAVPDGDTWIINGTKRFITHSPVCQLALIFAKDDTGRVSAFLVEVPTPGYSTGKPETTLGIKGSATAEIFLEDVRVPAANMLGAKTQGYGILLEAISVGKLGISTEGLAICQESLDLSIAYAKERLAYGKPIAELQTIQWLLAEMATRTEASRYLTYHAACKRDEGKSISYDAAVSKLFTSGAAVEVTRMAMQVHGAYGYTDAYPIERLYRDAKICEIYEGVSEIQRVIIASSLIR